MRLTKEARVTPSRSALACVFVVGALLSGCRERAAASAEPPAATPTPGVSAPRLEISGGTGEASSDRYRARIMVSAPVSEGR